MDPKNGVILTQLIQIYLSQDKKHNQNTLAVQKKVNSSDVYLFGTTVSRSFLSSTVILSCCI